MVSLGLTQDVAYAVRTMRRAPAFTAVAVLTLAAGIGVNTAMFSVVDRVLVRPLPYAHAESLFVLWNMWAGTERARLSNPEFLDFRERLRSADVAAYVGGSNNLTGRDEPQRLIFTAVTTNWLSLVGVTPALGRSFRREEERPGNDDVVILTDGLWRSLFAADAAAIGQTMISERTREFGIRLALGASARDVMRSVLGQGMAPAVAGVAVGLALSAAVMRAMTSLLFETAPLDPLIFAGVAALLLGAALAACVVPARRAMQVDPAIALRAE